MRLYAQTPGPTSCVVLLILTLLPVAPLHAQDDMEPYGPQPTGVEEAKTRHATNLVTYNGNTNVLVLPGLVAHRAEPRVEVLVESTGLGAEEAVEFLLIDKGSSHGYEGLLWSHAKPSDVHRALEFIGLRPGTPFNPAHLRFWADGDRVNLSVQSPNGDEFPIEQLVLDTEAGESLPEEGFIFAGSISIPSRDATGETVYVADVYDPRSIASTYNEPGAVLDVPRQAIKGEVYERQVVNPEYTLEHGRLLTVAMTPGDPDGQKRARHLALSFDRGRAGMTNGAGVTTGMVCRLTGADGKIVNEESSLTAMLEHVVTLRDEQAAPYVELSFGESLSVRAVSKISTLMAMMEAMAVVRIEPPAATQLYYRAFVPNKAWLEPAERPAQPWELHLVRADGKLSGRMVLHKAEWPDEAIEPTFTRVTFDVADSEAVRERLDADARARAEAGLRAAPAVLLVYTPADLTYGQLMAFIRPLLGTHGTVYVFLEGE